MPGRLDRGTLRLLLTDKPLDGNVEEVLVTISRVDLVYADPQQPIVSITPTQTSFDLLALRDGVTEEFGVAALPSGVLAQMRLIIDHAAITVDGRTGPLRIPSGPQTGIKLNGEVAIDPCTSVTVLLDFDAERSLHHAPGLARGGASGYVLKPVIAMRSVVTDRDQQAPAIAVAENGVITETESMAFHVAMQDPSGIDQASFAAELNGVDVSDRFMLGDGSAQSLELGLDRLGVNRLEVSVADACSNRARAIARVYRAAPGQKPEAFGVIDETGGRVAVDAAGRERVEVATRQLSTLQVWFEYPEHLVLDTIAGGGQRAIDAGGRDLGRRVALESPSGVDGLAGVAGEVLLLTEYWGTRIDRLNKTTGLLTNIKSAEAGPDGGETHYTAVMGALQPYCGGSWMCLYYAVEHRIEDPYSDSFATQVQIRRTDLSGVGDEVIAGRLGGDDGEGLPGIDSRLHRPQGLHYDRHRKELVVAEFYNNRVRRLHYRWRIFVRPDGCSVENDESCLEDGGTYSYPVGSINDALAIIKFVKEREDPPPDDDIEVVFMPAVSNTYYGQPVDWTYTMPEHSITFRPLDPNDPPIFAGCDPAAPCFDRGDEQHCRDCEEHPDAAGCPCDAQHRQENLSRCHRAGGDRRRAEEWFEYRLPDDGPGRKTNLVFDRLIVTGYQDGIGLRGQFEDDDLWVGSNSITNCTFHDLGDGAIEDFEAQKYEDRGKPRPGWAGIALANSRNNVVLGNTFDTLSNDYNIYEGGDTELYMHGVYLLWYANDNLVAENVFKRVSGDPIRVRDFSNFNTISDNLFSRSGYEAAYGEWYCNFVQLEPGHCTKAPSRATQECPSYENQFRNNILDGRFSREPTSCQTLDAAYQAFELQPGSDYLQQCCESADNPWSPLPCEPAGLWSRVEETGNVSTGGACACLQEDVQTVEDCRLLLGL